MREFEHVLQKLIYALHFSKSVHRLNKYVNLDVKNLTFWLNGNKMSLNVKKKSSTKISLYFLNNKGKNIR